MNAKLISAKPIICIVIMVYSVPLDIMTHHKQAYYRLHENAQHSLPIIALMKATLAKNEEYVV